MTGDHGEAQDVVQEAFVRAWDRRASFLAEEAPEVCIGACADAVHGRPRRHAADCRPRRRAAPLDRGQLKVGDTITLN
jgi:sigma-70-like protein